MCIKLFKRKTPNHQINTSEQNINVSAVVDFDKSSIKKTPRNIPTISIHGSVFYVVRVNIVNNEEHEIVCSASLEGGTSQRANAGWGTSLRRERMPDQIVGQVIFSQPIQISNNSYGVDPVEIEAGATKSGDFVFRIEDNAPHHRLKITVQCGDMEVDVYNRIISDNNGSLFEVNV